MMEVSMFPGVTLAAAHKFEALMRTQERACELWAMRDETRVEIDINVWLAYSTWCARCEATRASNTCEVAR
jgi:hypothetical protein